MMSSARSQSAGSTMSGGASRSTFSPAVSTSRPASRQASIDGPGRHGQLDADQQAAAAHLA